MSTYLYIWNPKRWKWVDQSEAVYRINNGEQYDMYWSCGNTKKIIVGDTFLLTRLGVDPKGIIGCGYIISTPYLLPHWDLEKAEKGQTTLRTDLLFKALSEEPIIPLETLKDHSPGYNWTPETGGLTIPEPIGSKLFSEIQSSTFFGFNLSSLSDVQLYVEGKSRIITSKTYDRNPRARQECIGYYGHNCIICGFNFEQVYGSIGINYIEVHHLHQVSDKGDEYLIDPIKDLRPVCANCHRMLHKSRPPLSIEDLLIYTRR